MFSYGKKKFPSIATLQFFLDARIFFLGTFFSFSERKFLVARKKNMARKKYYYIKETFWHQ